MSLTKYVRSTDEARKVLRFRAGYVERYGSFLAKTARLNDDSILVDVPCGAGGLSAFFSKKLTNGKIICVDINPNMVREARRNVRLFGSEFIVGDAADIANLVKKDIDAIFCANGFHIYIRRKMAFLKGCQKILRSNGILIFDVSTRGLNDELTREYYTLRGRIVGSILKDRYPGTRLTEPTWPTERTVEMYTDMIKKAGLRLRSLHEFNERRQSVEEALKEGLEIPGRSRPWLRGLTFKQRATVLTEATERTKEQLRIKEITHDRVFFVVEK